MPEKNLQKEKREIQSRYRNLLRAASLKAKSDKERKDDVNKIRMAFDIALEAHKDTRRKSGEPYIYHPLAVAQIVAEEIGLGATSIACALLHDTVEDTDITLDFIRSKFGDQVALIIDGLTKISGVFDNKGSLQAENFRKMLLTLSDDIRVILIKLADRLHNMRTLDSMSRNSQLKISSETLYIYSPLAHRLGLYAIKTEMEDLAIKYTEAEKYREIANKLQETKTQRNRYIRSFITPIESALAATGLKFEIKGRPKSIASILNKIKKNHVSFEEMYDIFAVRIIIDSPPETEKADCWSVYSIITGIFRPNPDRLKDWISTPKANGYESLHTTVMGPKGRWVEVQIRSKRMDEMAEKGLAAHWKYKESVHENALDEWIKKVREMLDTPGSNALEFIEDFKLNLFNDEIFVFTPKGELRNLPANATALDFAFEIHSDIGSRCIGAKVNNKLVPLSYKLQNGDQVEILTSSKQKPNEDWLNFVVTAKARTRIRESMRDEKKVMAELGKEMLERKFRGTEFAFNSQNLYTLVQHYKSSSPLDLYYAIATGDIEKDKINIEKILSKPEAKASDSSKKLKIQQTYKSTKINDSDTIILGDNYDLDYTFAKCCSPIPGDEVFGFVTIGEGIKVHRTNCPNAVGLMSNYGYRIIKAKWANDGLAAQKEFPAAIRVSGIDSVGLVSGITDVISKELQVNMTAISFSSNAGTFEGNIMLKITDVAHLEELMFKLKSINGLMNVVRVDI